MRTRSFTTLAVIVVTVAVVIVVLLASFGLRGFPTAVAANADNSQFDLEAVQDSTSSAISQAAPQNPAQYETAYEYVSKVMVKQDGYLWFNVKGNFTKAHGCPTPWWARSALKLDDYRTQAHMQIALSSRLAHEKIYVTTNGCTSDGYPIAINLMLFEN